MPRDDDHATDAACKWKSFLCISLIYHGILYALQDCSHLPCKSYIWGKVKEIISLSLFFHSNISPDH